MSETRVAVSGVRGRMGTLACEILSGSSGVTYAGGFAHGDDPGAFFNAAKPQILLDFTPRPITQTLARMALERGIVPVIGSSEWNDAEQAELAKLCKDRGARALLVPNFAIGAVLMMRFAKEAAAHFRGVEIVEMHRAEKRDKPSGTAAATAKRIKAGGFAGEVPIHSVRLPGVLAHQEVLLANAGELLTIRHDSLSRDSFASGILAAVRGAQDLPVGLSVGLEHVL